MDFKSVKLGVCNIFYKAVGETTFVDLGLTSGGCEWKYAPKWKELIADQYGETPIDYVLTGEAVSIKVPLIETTKKKMKIAMSGATVTGAEGAEVLTIGSLAGKRASDVAGTLVLHPISSGEAHADDITIFRAFNNGEVVLPFTIEKEQVMECTFVGLIDPNKANGSMLCSIGEDSMAIV
jgi:hypothetical protein